MKISGLLLLIAACALTLTAQVGSTMGGTSPTTGSGGQTSVQANPGLGSGGGARGVDTSRPLYLSGKVVMQDGSPVPRSVSIERVCGGIARTVAYTDSKGRFSFQWGDRSMVIPDAADAGSGSSRKSSSAGFGSSQSAGGANILASDPFGNRMMNCELRAAVTGFASDTVNLVNRRVSDNPDIGSIMLHRIAGVEGSSISITSMMAPKDARKAYERGLQWLLKDRPAEAAKNFEKAVALYPKYADAWLNLGKVRLKQNSIETARAALRKAMDADPKLVAPYVELGLLAAKDADWQESARYLDQAVALDPVGFPQAWYADAVANYNLQRYDAAEKGARAAVRLDSRHANPRSDYLLGLVLVEKKDYSGAAAEFASYLKLAPYAPDLPQAREQLSLAEKQIAAAK